MLQASPCPGWMNSNETIREKAYKVNAWIGRFSVFTLINSGILFLFSLYVTVRINELVKRAFNYFFFMYSDKEMMPFIF